MIDKKCFTTGWIQKKSTGLNNKDRNMIEEEMNAEPSPVHTEVKPHYVVLDGLRGVAALMVLVFHVYDACSANIIPHGYLAVDLFFLLSGFVIGYAYDDRWSRGLSVKMFFRRRLVRLHPMVLAGAALGGTVFLIQGHSMWDETVVSLFYTFVAILCTMLMLPTLPGMPTEVRGLGEYFPLNGPFWSLFYEYIGNVLYALLLRRLSIRLLALLCVLSGGCVLYASLCCGYLGVGWSAADGGWWFGFVRMLFPYTMGMLMARKFCSLKVHGAFWICGAMILAAGLMPVFGGEERPWLNGLYDFLCCVFLFPTIIWLGASDVGSGRYTLGLSRRLGELSYPLYAIHYPLMCLLFGTLGFDGNLLSPDIVLTQWLLALTMVLTSVVLAWLLLKFYDEPVRRRLSK